MSLNNSSDSLMGNMVGENSSPYSSPYNPVQYPTYSDTFDSDEDEDEGGDYYDREITQDDVTRAEVLWSLNCIMSFYPLSACNDIGSLFARMFPDSDIAQRFSFSRDKFMFILTHSLAPHFQYLLDVELKASPYYVISVDTSLNKSTSNEQINYYISFWNCVCKRVETRYFTSSFLVHAHSDVLLSSSLDVIKTLNPNKILQFSMVGSMINWSFLKALGRNREQNHVPKLIHIGSCDIYALHEAFRFGAEKTGWQYADLFTSLFTLVNASPFLHSEHEEPTNSHLLPLEFDNECWIENGNAAKRAIDIWKDIHKYMSTCQSRDNFKENLRYHIQQLKEFVDDKLIIAKLHFFVFVASALKPFIVNYSTSKPMVPFLHDDHHSIVRELMSWFIKRNILDNACTAKLLCDIDLDCDSNRLDTLNQNVGFAAESFLQVALKNDVIKLDDVSSFKKDCLVFLVELIEKITQKSCLLSSIAENAGSLNPNKMVTHPKLSVMQFDHLSQKLVELRRITTSEKEKTLREYNEFIVRVVNKYKGEFISFKPAEDRIDDFFFTEIGMHDYPSLSNIFILVLSLSHGQPLRCDDLEKYVQGPGMDEECIKAARTVHNHMTAKNMTTCGYSVDDSLLSLVNTSWPHYDEFVKIRREKLVKKRPSMPTFDIKKSSAESQGSLQQMCESYRMDIDKLVAKAKAEFTN